VLRFILLLLCLLTAAVHADADTNPIDNAFLFAGRRDWNNALSHATQSKDEVLVKLMNWEYLLDNDSGASHDEIVQFINANPDWPEQKHLRIRAELALHGGSIPNHEIIAYFKEEPPLTGVGKIALAEALMQDKNPPQEKITYLIRDGWRNGDFDEPQERQILEKYGTLLLQKDHIERIDRLLWEEKTAAAKRLLNHVPSDWRKLFKARLSLIADKRTAILNVAQVPSALKHDPGLIYDRMGYRARRDDNDGVRDMLLTTPAHVPYPEKWWKQREVQIRLAIGERHYAMAKKLLANHAQVSSGGLADALWLEGWLTSEFLDEPKTAYQSFSRMFDEVRYPVSKARAAYWAGRAAERAGDAGTAKSWYNKASAYPTTFYGQLASLKINGTAPLPMPAPPVADGHAEHTFDNGELARAIKLCAQYGQMSVAKTLVSFLAEHADSDTQAALVAGLGNRIGQPALSVHAAKKVMQQRGLVISDAGYPRPQTPSDLAVERPLTLAAARQESEFDPQVRSPSGALGLMQLMASTAKETARKEGVAFRAGQLTDARDNMTLGSLYLARMIASYNGSYIMAIAAYNAGPGNVHGWAQQFGTPGNGIDNAVNWIEKIPFSETRNYVQRVIENLQVYRYLEAEGGAPKLKLGEDLMR